jgi:RNase P subunit RPR2
MGKSHFALYSYIPGFQCRRYRIHNQGGHMKKLQCTECELVFWTELDLIGNQVIGSEEWVHVECPRCGEKWAIYEPGKKEKAEAIAAFYGS